MVRTVAIVIEGLLLSLLATRAVRQQVGLLNLQSMLDDTTAEQDSVERQTVLGNASSKQEPLKLLDGSHLKLGDRLPPTGGRLNSCRKPSLEYYEKEDIIVGQCVAVDVNYWRSGNYKLGVVESVYDPECAQPSIMDHFNVLKDAQVKADWAFRKCRPTYYVGRPSKDNKLRNGEDLLCLDQPSCPEGCLWERHASTAIGSAIGSMFGYGKKPSTGDAQVSGSDAVDQGRCVRAATSGQ